ncbi:hypothetical protein IAT38_000658 [Cryptococcus sp. DSM 104549]
MTLPLPHIQLACILSSIQTSRPVLVHLVSYLLSELRASSPALRGVRIPTQTAAVTAQPQVQTLEALTAPALHGKRKRSITHFDGIPLSVLSSSPSTSPSLFTATTGIPITNSPTTATIITPALTSVISATPSAPDQRRVIALKRVMDLGHVMSGMCLSSGMNPGLEAGGSERSSARSSGSFASFPSSGEEAGYGFGYGYGYGDNKPIDIDYSSDEAEQEEESESDDEDDVVLVFHR